MDAVARALALEALNKAGGGSSPSGGYTDAQIDAKLEEKAEKDEVEAQINGVKSIVDNAILNRDAISGSDADFNLAYKSGLYKYYGSPKNKPSTQTYGVLLVLNPGNLGLNGSTTYIVQIAFAGVSAAHFKISSTAGVYVRTTADGGITWSEWFALALSAATSVAVDRMEIMDQVEVPDVFTQEKEKEDISNERTENL